MGRILIPLALALALSTSSLAATPAKKAEPPQLIPLIEQFQKSPSDSLLISIIAYLVSYKSPEDSIYAAEAKAWAAVAKADLYWVNNGDETGRILFEKLSGAGLKNAQCVGNGIKISASTKPAYSPNAIGNIRCSYTPQLTVTTCDGSPIDVLTFGQTFNSSNKDQSVATQRVLEGLRNANFSAWVNHLKSLRK
ncbi:MAG: hypothetical protein FWC15_07660 [Fibromonadales bacterium]|nr:hypothetical protein [Fibromonadales bacterium]